MKLLSLLGLVLLMTLFVVHGEELSAWTNCGTKNDLFTISSITVTPDIPTRGSAVNVTLVGQLHETVPSIMVKLQIKYNNKIVMEKDRDVCSKVKCPVAPGQYHHPIQTTLPSLAPAGKYTVHIFAISGEKTLACANIPLTIK
ncbi:hypothetical protein CYY_005073 [Polysphondylium violaceum]|uniref:MD-2-related lipid-recognition domain-containing protein n=1 Tax=Polysphondylium violaceum TaxID=133409 RepID=A0A8J4Q449_9MYCE|nr:hypothetical protein CYY_005073 [Polysphondylium violaceum]